MKKAFDSVNLDYCKQNLLTNCTGVVCCPSKWSYYRLVGQTPLVVTPATSTLTCGLGWYSWGNNSRSLSSHTCQPYGFALEWTGKQFRSRVHTKLLSTLYNVTHMVEDHAHSLGFWWKTFLHLQDSDMTVSSNTWWGYQLTKTVSKWRSTGNIWNLAYWISDSLLYRDISHIHISYEQM